MVGVLLPKSNIDTKIAGFYMFLQCISFKIYFGYQCSFSGVWILLHRSIYFDVAQTLSKRNILLHGVWDSLWVDFRSPTRARHGLTCFGLRLAASLVLQEMEGLIWIIFYEAFLTFKDAFLQLLNWFVPGWWIISLLCIKTYPTWTVWAHGRACQAKMTPPSTGPILLVGPQERSSAPTPLHFGT